MMSRPITCILLLFIVFGFPLALPAQIQTPAQRWMHLLAERAHPINEDSAMERLMQAIGERRFALLGESTHGTSEYYIWRDRISRRLIEERGFQFVAVEGDWQAIFRLNDYVKHRLSADATFSSVMAQNTRWPAWMWNNEEFEVFVEWLREFNATRVEAERIGLYGLDLQDPVDAIHGVMGWFDVHDSENAEQVRSGYACLLRFEDQITDYARQLAQGGASCTVQVRLPVDILRTHLEQTATHAAKPVWAAKQGALSVKESEKYIRAMLAGGPHSWNQRARYMHETFLRIAEWHGPDSRGIVWAHNTHVGDSSASEMRERGEVNIGKLLRESAGEEEVFILGFGSLRGTVIAGPRWGAPLREMEMPDARSNSVEAFLAGSGLTEHLVILDGEFREDGMRITMPQRAVGVVYAPPNEAYVRTTLSQRYDAFIFLRETSALRPRH